MTHMADPVRKNDQHYTYRYYEEWPADERWELIDGVAWNMSPAPSIAHQRALGMLSDVFREAARRAGCEALFAPVDVLLFTRKESDIPTADTVVQPDLFVACDTSRLAERGYLGAPDIVVEVLSPYTMRKDLTVKLELYERAGVREYWIADPGNGAIMIYRLGEDGRFPVDPEIVTKEGTAYSSVLPGVEVTLDSPSRTIPNM